MITGEKTVLALKARTIFTVKTKRENVTQNFLSVGLLRSRWCELLNSVNLQTLTVCQRTAITAFSHERGEVYWNDCWLDTLPKCLLSIRFIHQVSAAWSPYWNSVHNLPLPALPMPSFFCSPDVSQYRFPAFPLCSIKTACPPPPSPLHYSTAAPSTFFCLVLKYKCTITFIIVQTPLSSFLSPFLSVCIWLACDGGTGVFSSSPPCLLTDADQTGACPH